MTSSVQHAASKTLNSQTQPFTFRLQACVDEVDKGATIVSTYIERTLVIYGVCRQI
jgi:hypothetical protein